VKMIAYRAETAMVGIVRETNGTAKLKFILAAGLRRRKPAAGGGYF
jgi:hypothetical protein